LTVLSLLPEAKDLPSGDIATEAIDLAKPFNVQITFYFYTLHSLIVLS
jgi:hypothetical protein